MDSLLFSSRSIWTMIHGIVLGGGALIALSAALFSLWAMRAVAPAGIAGEHFASTPATTDRQARDLARLTVVAAGLLWLTVLIGTYVSFPPYRATPPEGLADLAQYPRALLRANPGTAWLHSFAMETKEHVPWIAAMAATAVAFVATRYRSQLLRDAPLRRMAMTLLAASVVLVSYVSLLGVFINKVAPLD